MNKCHFLGKLSDEPELGKMDGTSVVNFELEVEEFRKDSNGEKIRTATYLSCEAWDSAALAIAKYTKKGTIMAVESIARNEVIDGENYTYFRVTNFKILGL